MSLSRPMRLRIVKPADPKRSALLLRYQPRSRGISLPRSDTSARNLSNSPESLGNTLQALACTQPDLLLLIERITKLIIESPAAALVLAEAADALQNLS